MTTEHTGCGDCAETRAAIERIEQGIFGDPADPARPGIDGRLRTVEREWGYAKRGALSALTLGVPAAWAYIKSKLGNQ